MITYQIVAESDNVARYVIRHDDLLGKTYSGPGVTVVSQGYLGSIIDQQGLSDIPSALAQMGLTSALSEEDLSGLL